MLFFRQALQKLNLQSLHIVNLAKRVAVETLPTFDEIDKLHPEVFSFNQRQKNIGFLVSSFLPWTKAYAERQRINGLFALAQAALAEKQRSYEFTLARRETLAAIKFNCEIKYTPYKDKNLLRKSNSAPQLYPVHKPVLAKRSKDDSIILRTKRIVVDPMFINKSIHVPVLKIN